MVAEIFPLGVRAKAISIGASSNWLNNFAVRIIQPSSLFQCANTSQIGQATPQMVAQMGYGTFIFFGAMCILGALFIYFVVPETKNLTLEEMDEVFGDEAGSAIEDRNRLLQIYTELGLLDFGSSEEKPEAVIP